jgi:phage terminase large subunit-like protein
LASTTDLAAWVLLFPPAVSANIRGAVAVLDSGGADPVPRRRTPAARRRCGRTTAAARRPRATGSTTRARSTLRSSRQADFRIVGVGYDQKEATATAQFMQKLGLEVEPVARATAVGSLKEIMRLVKAARAVHHGGNPVARWNADSVEVRQDDQERIKLVKPERGRRETDRRVGRVG